MALIEGLAGSGHCQIHIGRITAGNFGQRQPGGRVESGKSGAMAGAVFAVNKSGAREVEICGQRLILCGC